MLAGGLRYRGRLGHLVLLGCLWLLALPSLTRADALDEVIRFYNPKLAAARPVAECVIGGDSVKSCATQAGKAELEQDADFQNILELMALIDAKKYHEVAAKAGLTAACAWVEFPGKDVICGGVAGAVLEAGQEALGATKAVAAESQKVAGGLGSAVKCVVGDCGGSAHYDMTLDAEAAWTSCYVPRLEEGIRARSGNARSWTRLINTILKDNRFEGGSLIGDCAVGQSPFGPLLNANGQDIFAVSLQAGHQPLRKRYMDIVEAAVLDTLAPVSADYKGRQSVATLRAYTQAATYFTLPNMVQLVMIANGEETECVEALSGESAAFLGAWSEVGLAAKSGAMSEGFTALNWSEQAPKPWCKGTFSPVFKKALNARRVPYLQAIEKGCTKVGGNVRHLSCPAVGGTEAQSALGKCREAFQGLDDARCDLAVARATGTAPDPSQSAPPVTQTPQTAAPTRRLPPQTQPQQDPPPPPPPEAPTTLPKVKIRPA